MPISKVLLVAFVFIAFLGCRNLERLPVPIIEDIPFYKGVDLSYVNEMEDCDGIYRENGQEVDPYLLFSDKGADIIRLRLWHTPDWTDYSTLTDVKKSIGRAKGQGMKVLLDFHYSDDWADPGSQEIPAAWSDADTKETIGDYMYNYTYDILMDLSSEGLLPEIVQVGNEINNGMLRWSGQNGIDWANTVYYLQRGFQAIAAVEAATGEDIETMVHIAQPENADWWFPQAFSNGLGSFDWIGLSYYPVWSDVSLDNLSESVADIKKQFNKEVMIVETAYPHSLTDVDNANNILGTDALITGYEASPAGQKQFLLDLLGEVEAGGGKGVIYWEPAWISSSCSTRWGEGSHWDNATFFDGENNNEVLPAIEFLGE